MNLKKTLINAVAAASLSLSMSAFASGVPTIDSANISQLFIQFERLGLQLEQMTENVNQVTKTTENFIGQISYYKDLIDNIEFRKVADGYVPVNVAEVLAIIEDGVGSENPEIQATIDEIMNSSPALVHLEEGAKYEALAKSRRNMAYYQAAFNESYEAAGRRQEMAHELGNRSAEVSDEKEARALSLAMQSENLVAVNELAKLLSMEQMKQQQAEIEEQNRLENAELIKQNRLDFFNERLGINNDFNQQSDQ